MSIEVVTAKSEFESHFGFAPEIGVRAPGRVNIIGEHTDYNHGFVLPMAIERETVILAKPRTDRMLNAYAANYGRSVHVSLDERVRNANDSWIDYVLGVADELAKLGLPLTGADLMIIGDVPLGSGLSSSAALEMASLVMFETLGGFVVEGADAPKLGQRVENVFLGLSTGIMDQFISRMGKQGHALFLDCRTSEYELVPVAFADSAFVIANTCVSRGLTSSKYNERVSECSEAVRVMNAQGNKVGTHLRDFTMEDLMACKDQMPDVVFRRARHVLSEDARTKAACEAMRLGDPKILGSLMTASDVSLKEDYEVTCPELDAMTEVARSLPGCYGARMTGAGFGGCTVHLVAQDALVEFQTRLMEGYLARTGIKGEIIVSVPAEGASRVF